PTTTYLSTLSLHDALPICCHCLVVSASAGAAAGVGIEEFVIFVGDDSVYVGVSFRLDIIAHVVVGRYYPLQLAVCLDLRPHVSRDRKSTRLNSSHDQISYA